MSRNTPWRTARRQMNLYQPDRNDWYRIKNQTGGPTQLHIYDEIGYFGVSAKDLIRDLADVSGPLEVHLNSPGGEVFDGIAIYNTLMARRDVTVMIDGIAASIASVIACAGNPVLMARNAQLMIHEGHAMAIGNAQDMRDLAEQLERTSNNIASIYAERTGKPLAYWRDLMKAETWMDLAEAMDCGLVDRAIDSGAGRAPLRNEWDMSIFTNGAHQRDATAPPYVGTDQPMHRPMTGRHAHAHAAFGDSDHDDGMHHHVHEHSNDATHDHTHVKPSNRNPDPDHDGDDDRYPWSDTDHDFWSRWGEISHDPDMATHLAVVALTVWNSWNAAAAMAKCHSASDYRSICAGRRAGDPSLEKTWALPHHDSPGGPANPDGVSAALGRLNQTEGLVNKAAAEKHLKAHQGKGKGEKNHSHADLYDDTEMARVLESLRGV